MYNYSSLSILFSIVFFVSCASDINDKNPIVPGKPKLTIDDTHSYAKLDKCKVTHMKLDLRTDFTKKSITGAVRYDFELIEGNELILDIRDLDIHKVYMVDKDEAGLNYTLGKVDPIKGQSLTIELPSNHENSVHVMYSTRPSAAALQWLEAEQTKDKTMEFLYTQGQAILTRTWLPCQDSPGARITYDADIFVPVGMMAAMSAKNPITKDPKGRFAFTMKQPIPPYLIALAVGDFEFAPIGAQTGVYAESSVLEAAVYEFGQMQEMLEAAEALYGPYLWKGMTFWYYLPPSLLEVWKIQIDFCYAYYSSGRSLTHRFNRSRIGPFLVWQPCYQCYLGRLLVERGFYRLL